MCVVLHLGLVFLGLFSVVSPLHAGPFLDGQRQAPRVADALKRREPSVRRDFVDAGAAFPPSGLLLRHFKAEGQVEVWAPSADPRSAYRLVRTLGVCMRSGDLGPKVLEGDLQVPEGVYTLARFNPRSRFHLSLGLDYPNPVDRQRARRRGRPPGGDIMIHGKAVSIGCLAMGDKAAEDLFVLAADTGLKNIEVVLTPVDFRLGKNFPKAASFPPWSESLYESIKARLRDLPTSNPR